MRLRSGTEAGLFSGSLALSLGLHLLLAASVLMGIGFQKPAAPPVLTVSLVAPEPVVPAPAPVQASAPAGGQAGTAGAPSVPPAPVKKVASPPPPLKEKPRKRQAPPAAEPEPEEVWPVIPRRPAPPPPPVAKAPAPAPTVLPYTRPVPPAPAIPAAAPSSPRTTDVGVAVRGGSGATAGQTQAGAGSGGSSSAALGYGKSVGDGRGDAANSAKAQSAYVNLIRSRILSRRQYPHLARQRREEGVVRLRFTLSAGGSLQGVQVVAPSGSQLLDDQGRHCVLSAGPFPPFPLDLRRDTLTLEVPIVYKLTEMGM